MVEFQSFWQDTESFFFFFKAQPEFLVNLQVRQEKRLPPVSIAEAVPQRAGGIQGDWSGTAKRIHLQGFQHRTSLSKGPAAVLWNPSLHLHWSHAIPVSLCCRLRVAEIIGPSHFWKTQDSSDRPCGLEGSPATLQTLPQTAWRSGLPFLPSFSTEGSELPGGLTALSDLPVCPVYTHRHFL